jgi:hypothetical protein
MGKPYSPPEEFLDIVRALAIRAAREDHDREMARLRNPPPASRK